MPTIYCRKETTFTESEKAVFMETLSRSEMTPNLWDLFDEWVARSDSRVQFFFVKVFQDAALIGVGLFLKVKPVDLRASYAGLRNNRLLSVAAMAASALGRNCVYVGFRNLITANITRPVFYVSPDMEEPVMSAMLEFLKSQKDADMVTLVDTTDNDRHYENAGFQKYPSSSEAYFDATGYSDIGAYLKDHRSLRKNLKRRKAKVETCIQQGPVSRSDLVQIKACMDCSVENSRVNNPCQLFFEKHVFDTNVFHSGKYVHILIRVEGRIAGFHTFLVCGAHLGGVLGGFNRDLSKNNYVYERVIVASLEYAIQQGLKKVHYSLVDNHTKLRLVDHLTPCGLYLYSGNLVHRLIFKHTFQYNDVYALYQLEKQKGG